MEEESRRTALLRAATQAYEAAHGNPLPEPVRGLRWSIRPRVAATVLALVAVIVAGMVFASRLGPSPVPMAPQPTDGLDALLSGQGSLTVHVAGAVAAPGVYTLAPGARVGEAITAAGGAAPEADLASVNLARPLQDGEQVVVARIGDTSVGVGSGLLNLNTVDAAALEALPGIGPVLAERIVSDRERHGPFQSVDDLDRVSGIGAAVLGQVRDLLTV